MELTNEFEVPADIDDAWQVLSDVGRIVPFLPGAQLNEVADDEYRGLVKLKFGPLTASYRGAARVAKLEPDAHRAVLIAEGREARGQGNATATITAEMTEREPGRTTVRVATDLSVTGRVGELGRGVLADTSSRFLEEFASNVRSAVWMSAEGSPPDDSPPPSADGPGEAQAQPSDQPDAEPAAPTRQARGGDEGTSTDGLSSAESDTSSENPPPVPFDLEEDSGAPLLRRLAPYASIAGTIFLLRIVVYAFRRRKK